MTFGKPADVAQTAQRVRDGQSTATTVVEETFERIATLNPRLNAFSDLCVETARAEAAALDAHQTAGKPLGPLHGVPIAIKDENDVAGLPTAYGGAAFTTPADEDSEVVRRLRAAGAVIIGKTRMPEFGIWPFTETEAHGITRNPWDLTRSPAGSSGGTAAAVASGMVPAGIGGDGGGSIRLPASWCGLFGLKPTRGLVSAAPHPDLWGALGVIGPLTHTVADSALIYDAIAGSTRVDRFQSPTLTGSLTQAASDGPRGRLRIQVTLENPTVGPRADDETIAAVLAAAEALALQGHDVIHGELRYPKITPSFLTQFAAGVADEAERAEFPDRLEHRTRRLAGVGRVTRRLRGRAESWANKASAAFDQEQFSSAGIDAILMPVTPTPAVTAGQLTGKGLIAALQTSSSMATYTGIWNVLGNPAASVPFGFTTDGLPLGVQLVAARGGDTTVMALSAALESVHPEPSRLPTSLLT